MTRVPMLIAFVLTVCVVVDASAQSSRRAKMLQDRLQAGFEQEFKAAVQLCQEKPDEFIKKYLSSTPDQLPPKSYSEQQLQHLQKLMKLFSQQPNWELKENQMTLSIKPEAGQLEEMTRAASELFPPLKVEAAAQNWPGYGDNIKVVLQRAIGDLKQGNTLELIKRTFPVSQLTQLSAADELQKFPEQVQSQLGGWHFMLKDLQQMEQEEPQFTEEEGRKFAVWAVNTNPEFFAGPNHHYRLEKRFPLQPRAIVMELDNGDWRFQDGQRLLREMPVTRFTVADGEGSVSMVWQLTEEGWQLESLPFFVIN